MKTISEKKGIKADFNLITILIIPIAIAINFIVGNLVPVSYTHLDVYKRQKASCLLGQETRRLAYFL